MTVGRRDFLALSVTATVAFCAIPRTGLALPASRRGVSLFDPHRRETLSVEYWVEGWYDPDALARLNWFMRDRRNDAAVEMDPGLIDILYAVQQRIGAGEPLHIVSAYRSPQTNAYLAARSRGVARNSYHMYGRACDIEAPGVGVRDLRQVAMSLQAGGVGYYPRSGFVHVDNGPVRDW
jgi:uncharacterized protein YcbK (DUF882 family)